MIRYDHGTWGILFAMRIRGSVFPKALVIAIPAGVISAVLNLTKTQLGYTSTVSSSSVMVAFASFISVLGFMVVFRSNLAYARYWEGAALVQQVRGEWFNAASSLVAFTSRKPEDRERVQSFHSLIVRLMSLMYGTALTTLSGSTFEIVDLDGIDLASKEFLESSQQEVKCEVIMQWIQRSIVDNIGNGVLPIAPPILSRVFQELSGGVVKIAAARKINDLPFPFHYAQMLAVMLVVYSVGVPCAAGYVMESWWGAGGSTFFNVFVLWAVNYLAVEIESPFGDDANDLPIHEEMSRMNTLLHMLVHKEPQSPPTYDKRALSRRFTQSIKDHEYFSFEEPEAPEQKIPIAAQKVNAPASISPQGPEPHLPQQVPLPAEAPKMVANSGSDKKVFQPDALAGFQPDALAAFQPDALAAFQPRPEPKDKQPQPFPSVGKRQKEQKSLATRDGSRAFKKVPHDRLRHAGGRAPEADEAELESCSEEERHVSATQYSIGGVQLQRSGSNGRSGGGPGKPPVPPVPAHLPK